MSYTQNSLASPPRSHRENDHITTTPSASISRHGHSRVYSSTYAEPESPIASVRRPRSTANRTPSLVGSPNNSSYLYQRSSMQNQPSSQSQTTKTPHIHKSASGKPQGTPSALLFSPQFGNKPSASGQQQNGLNGIHPTATSETSLVEKHVEILEYLPVDESSIEHWPHPLHNYRPLCMKCIDDIFIGGYLDQMKLQQLLTYWNEEDNLLDPYFFIRDLPPLHMIIPTVRKSPLPVKQADTPRITLALDLDETLAHSSTSHIEHSDFSFDVNFNGADYVVYARIRPHLEHFLKQVSQWFEVVVFTASQKVYADSILNLIDPMNEYITHRVFRDSCVCVDKNYVKDLSILGRPLEHVIIVDNSIQAFGYHLNNGIPIESWFDDDMDCELLNLIPFLRHLKDVDDVRPYLRDAFHLQQFVDALPTRSLNDHSGMNDR